MAVGLLLTSVGWCSESRLQDHTEGIWSLLNSKNEKRWIVIHNISQSAKSGVYHIEDLSLGKGEPVWKVHHLVNHMAITQEALLRSIIAPLKKGAVYPEAFDSAYKDWQSKNAGAGGVICKTQVSQCL